MRKFKSNFFYDIYFFKLQVGAVKRCFLFVIAFVWRQAEEEEEEEEVVTTK